MKAMLETPMTESSTRSLSVQDIDGETMKEILRFMYTGMVENIEKLASKLLYGAEKYGIDELKDLCEQDMIENLSTTNAVEYYTLAYRYNIESLYDKCIDFIKL